MTFLVVFCSGPAENRLAEDAMAGAGPLGICFALGETYVIEFTYCQPEAPKGITKMMSFFFQADFLNASLAGLSRAR